MDTRDFSSVTLAVIVNRRCENAEGVEGTSDMYW
jgi:hypothetical protein